MITAKQLKAILASLPDFSDRAYINRDMIIVVVAQPVCITRSFIPERPKVRELVFRRNYALQDWEADSEIFKTT